MDAIADTVRAVKLTSIPGENVSGYMQTVIPLLEDIEMAAMTFSQVPNMTSLALTGLMSATDIMIPSKTKDMFCTEDGDGSAASDVSTLPKAMAALTVLENSLSSSCPNQPLWTSHLHQTRFQSQPCRCPGH